MKALGTMAAAVAVCLVALLVYPAVSSPSMNCRPEPLHGGLVEPLALLLPCPMHGVRGRSNWRGVLQQFLQSGPAGLPVTLAPGPTSVTVRLFWMRGLAFLQLLTLTGGGLHAVLRRKSVMRRIGDCGF